MMNKHPDWAIDGLVPCGRGAKFKIPLPRSFVPRPIKYTCQVSSTLAQRSQSLGVLKMLTLDGRTDGQTDRRMHAQTHGFEQFSQSSRTDD